MRGAFLALAWSPRDVAAVDRAQTLGAQLNLDTAWRAAGELEGLRLWVSADYPLPIMRLPHGQGLVVGQAFPMPGRPEKRPSAGVRGSGPTTFQLAQQLSRSLWGQYVALLRSPNPSGEAGLYRDPCGMVKCLVWSLGDGVDAIGSDFSRAPGALRPRRASLDWNRIGRFLSVPSAATTAPLFDDVEAVGPGEHLGLGAGPRRLDSIWSPAEFAASGSRGLEDVQRELVERVDHATRALVQDYRRLLVELSGGLDSSILAGSIAATGNAGRVREWFHITDSRPEADESAYARAVTQRLGAPLATFARTIEPIEPTDLAELAMGIWPGGAGADTGRDRFELERVRATGADAIVSGQGGDGVFFQFPSALVAADEFARYGMKALFSPVLADVARRTRTSVWDVLQQVHAARRGRAREPKVRSTIISRDLMIATAGEEHAWVRRAREHGLPPGKILHVRGIANTHIYHGFSRRGRVADTLYPLFSQPVVELCLAVPTPDLAGGNHDRPFARAAFSERLPPVVLQRRTKGNHSAFYGRLVASSLDALRPFLLDGCLCSAGLLDRRALEQALDPARLIWEAAPTDILWAASVEAWVRHWQTRVPDSPTAPRQAWR